MPSIDAAVACFVLTNNVNVMDGVKHDVSQLLYYGIKKNPSLTVKYLRNRCIFIMTFSPLEIHFYVFRTFCGSFQTSAVSSNVSRDMRPGSRDEARTSTQRVGNVYDKSFDEKNIMISQPRKVYSFGSSKCMLIVGDLHETLFPQLLYICSNFIYFIFRICSLLRPNNMKRYSSSVCFVMSTASAFSSIYITQDGSTGSSWPDNPTISLTCYYDDTTLHTGSGKTSLLQSPFRGRCI